MVDNEVIKKGEQAAVSQFSTIQFPCRNCCIPHLYHLSFLTNDINNPELTPKNDSKYPLKNCYTGHLHRDERSYSRVLKAKKSLLYLDGDMIKTIAGCTSVAKMMQVNPLDMQTNGFSDQTVLLMGDPNSVWTAQHKEGLKRYLFYFGFGRWTKIRKVSDLLSKVPYESLQYYALSFFKMLYQNLPRDIDQDLRNFLTRKIQENPLSVEELEGVCSSDLKNWGGDKIMSTIQQWTRRLHHLDILQKIVGQWKQQKREFFNRPEDQQDTRLAQQYRSADNLVSFCSNDQLAGMKPSVWWQRNNDVDLLLGVYRYGFGNYNAIKEDQRLTFTQSDIDTQSSLIQSNEVTEFAHGKGLKQEQMAEQRASSEFPPAEYVTKRLKKILMLGDRIEKIDFECVIKPDKTGLKLNEKLAATKILADMGLDSSSSAEGSLQPFCKLKIQIQEKTQQECVASERAIEKFVNQLQLEAMNMVRQFLTARAKTEDYISVDQNEFSAPKDKELFKNGKLKAMFEDIKYDPDQDGFNFGVVESFTLVKRTSLFTFIRQKLFADDARGFTNGAEALETAHKDIEFPNVPEAWETPKNDLGLFMAICDKGIGFLRTARYQGGEYNLDGFKMNKKKLLKRAEWSCSVLRQHFNSQKPVKQVKLESFDDQIGMGAIIKSNQRHKQSSNSFDQIKATKAPNINIRTDASGNIVYPIEITGTLKILNLGKIDYRRQAFHTSSNIFPIGYQSIREHASITTLGARANYVCEILDDGQKPLFRVTCSEDPDCPVERETASGCWLEFIKRINTLQQTRKSKPSVSGPDRYGLSEPAVLKIMQNMPNSDLLKSYRHKQFV